MRFLSKAYLAGATVLVAAAGLCTIAWSQRGKSVPPVHEAIPASEQPMFEDVTAQAQIDFTYQNGVEANQYAILESLGGGVALIDFDGDGLLDIFLTGGGTFVGPDSKQIKGSSCKLYRNLGNWKFQDVTREVGLDTVGGEPWFYTHGCAVADYDNDGWPDLLVTGYGRLALFHNVPDKQTGGRRFQEVTKAAGLLGGHFWSTSAAWADLDGDGYPDLYVCQYVDWSFANNPACPGYSKEVERDICPPQQFEARPHALYRNNGNGTFTEVGKDAGLHTARRDEDYARLRHLSASVLDRLRVTDRDRDFGKGLGVVIADVNGDGRPDIYVANDTTDKFLYLNRSTPGSLRFEDVAVFAGVARDDNGAPNGSMGLDVADYDHTGRASLLVTNYQNELPALYRNDTGAEPLIFTFNSAPAGLTKLGRQYVGFGTAFVDLDNDGWDDIVIVNGHVIRHPSRSTVRQKPVLLRNQGNSSGITAPGFLDVTAQGGAYFQVPHQGRGLAVGDLDNDGWPDLVVSHVNEPVAILRNTVGRGHHWLGIQLEGKNHRDVVGAKLTLEVGTRRLTHFSKGGGSYLSSNDRRCLFGLGADEKVGRLTVAWPWGKEQHWDNLSCDRYWTVTAGEVD